MSNTGWILTGQGRSVDQASQTAWTNPGNITADDASNATCTADGSGDTTDWIVADTFGALSIPSTATIRGIEFKVQVSSSVTNGGGATSTGFKGLNVGKDDSTLGTAKTVSLAITGSAADYTFGGPQDLWGLTWTVAEAEADGTQARAYFENDNKNPAMVATFSVDAVWIRVWYTIPGETVIFLTTTGSGQTWSVPNDWNSLNNTVECIGGVGNAVAWSGTVGGGGGGGAYSLKSNVPLNPGTSINYRVGDGLDGTNDTWFNGTTLSNASCSAEGGIASHSDLGGGGGQASNGVGDTKFNGGNGGNKNNGGLDNGGGGGGGAAGPHGAGGGGGQSNDGDGEDGGAGGGGADGGGSGSGNSDNVSGAGGVNRQGQAGGTTVNNANGNAGSNGSGGSGGSVSSKTGGAGSFEPLWRQTSDGSTAGPGSGSGAGGGTSGAGGSMSGYGGGRGGSTSTTAGGDGLIVISYFSNTGKVRSYIVG